LRQAEEETGAASFLTVKARVARAFLQIVGDLSGPGTITIQTNVRQNDLAASRHCARESVGRVLGEVAAAPNYRSDEAAQVCGQIETRTRGAVSKERAAIEQ
jgi:hypothetical protein